MIKQKKKKKNRLALKSETIRALSGNELPNVVGGLIPTGSPTGICPTNNRACATGVCTAVGCTAGCPQASASCP